jgi:hypothetical protein
MFGTTERLLCGAGCSRLLPARERPDLGTVAARPLPMRMARLGQPAMSRAPSGIPRSIGRGLFTSEGGAQAGDPVWQHPSPGP